MENMCRTLSHMWCRQEIMKIHFGLCFGIFISFSSCHTQNQQNKKLFLVLSLFSGRSTIKNSRTTFSELQKIIEISVIFLLLLRNQNFVFLEILIKTKQLKYITLRCQLRITRNIFCSFLHKINLIDRLSIISKALQSIQQFLFFTYFSWHRLTKIHLIFSKIFSSIYFKSFLC